MNSHKWAALAAACILAGSVVNGFAADRWEIAGSGAVAILPAPTTSNGIESGSLYCTEQKWGLLFRVAPNALGAAATAPAKVTISGNLIQREAKTSANTASIPLPIEALGSLKAGTSLAIEIGPVETGVTATFSLRGSRLAIEAIAPKCSQVDMSPFVSVSLSETDGSIEAAKSVAADEMKLFREATGKQPVIASKQLDLPSGNALLFVSVCGSTRYYGGSGCNLTGHARSGAAGDWKLVYNTEGMFLYTDPESVKDGWPDLVTLPVMNGFEPTHWTWAGDAYRLRSDTVLVGEGGSSIDDRSKEQGDTAQ